MAVRPTETLQWASQTIQEVVDIGGQQVLVVNKTEPPQAFKNTGILARERVSRPRINWVLDLISRYVNHLDQRLAVGDVHMSNINQNVNELSERLGGTWELLGTTTIGSSTIYNYIKTA